jgi:hypothetical protein
MNALTASLPALRLHIGQLLAGDWVGLLLDPCPPASAAPAATHVLQSQQTHWFDTVAGQQVSCLDGCVLLHYQERARPREVILVRGESHTCAVDARLAVQALVGTQLRID